MIPLTEKMHSIKIFILALILLTSFNNFASHVSGGNITYKSTGIPNQYIIKLSLSRDCSGINAPTNVTISIKNSCGFADTTLNMPLSSSTENSQVCPIDLPNTTCNGGTLPGFEIYYYVGIINLADTCDFWNFSYSLCDRNPSTNLATTACFYVETKLYSATNSLNNSVIVNTIPTPYFCDNSPAFFDLGTSDSDADSLVFTFVSALSGALNQINYNAGFSVNAPIPGITLDPLTGQLAFSPIISGNFVVTILIEEYNHCGNLVGSVMNDMQFIVTTCNNAVPLAPNSILNFNNNGTNAILNGNTIDLCSGDQFCFDIVFSDPDIGDVLDLSSNVTTVLPGATFTQTGTNPATATICWAYHPGYLGTTFSILANDQVCPIPGIAKLVMVDLKLAPSYFAGVDTTINICKDSIINLGNYIIGNSLSGYWFDPNFNAISSIIDTDTITSGTYLYITNSPSNPNPCNSNFLCSQSDTSILNLNLSDIVVNPSVIPSSSPGAIDGSISFNIQGGIPPYTTNGSLISSPISAPFTTTNINSPWLSLPEGDYVIEAIDSIGCFSNDSISIGLLGINKYNESKEFKVYPTIVDQNILTIKNESQFERVTVNITDVNGKIISSKKILNSIENIDLNCPNGVYFYIISSPNGNVLQSSKFIINS